VGLKVLILKKLEGVEGIDEKLSLLTRFSIDLQSEEVLKVCEEIREEIVEIEEMLK
jgi:hypothetical protein